MVFRKVNGLFKIFTKQMFGKVFRVRIRLFVGGTLIFPSDIFSGIGRQRSTSFLQPYDLRQTCWQDLLPQQRGHRNQNPLQLFQRL